MVYNTLLRKVIMNDFIFIAFTVLITTGLIYFLYIIMLGSDKAAKDTDLQITSEDLLQQLRILHREKKYNIVESLAKNYLAQKGNDYGVRTILAKSLYASGRVFDAIEQAKAITIHQPQNYEIQIFLANCYFEVEKTSNAIETLQRVLEKDSGNVLAIKELSQIYLKTNQKKSAIEMLKRLEDFLESNSEKVKNKSLIGGIYVEFRELESAINEYHEILEIYPDDIPTKMKLVELFKMTSDIDALTEITNDIIKTNKNNKHDLWAMQTLLDTYRTMQYYPKALEYAYSIKEHPLADKKQIEETIAKILFEGGQVEEGIELLISLIADNPKNIELKRELAKAYQAKQQFELAQELYEQILDIAEPKEVKTIHSEISTLYSNWAIYMFSKDMLNDCYKYFTTALKYNDKNVEIYYNLGNINKIIKNFNESITQYKKAIELDPQNAEYYNAIAESYKEIDSVYEQKKALLEGLKYNPDNSQAHYTLGTICKAQNDYQAAIQHVNEAVSLDKNFTEAKILLALLFEHVGDIEHAINTYEKILLIEPENEEAIRNLNMLKGITT